MPFVADLHIHSHFSIATSRKLIPEYLDHHARLKGIRLVGTGDATHPGWVDELEEKLDPVEGGLYRLKPGLGPGLPLPGAVESEKPPLFLVTAEISTIYKWDDRIRKVHHLILLSGIQSARSLQRALSARGANITSDGRPILGMDSRDLLEIVLEADRRAMFIPAHIWTPWFSALGSRSGFDSIRDCYRDLSDQIHAVETGLSTDPPMHWICSHLDEYTLISNSDAHSPDKLGRNAFLLDTPMDFDSITRTIREGDPRQFKGTIDLFPQEGKYHFDGHRKCGIRWNPLETLEHDGICSCCGRPITEGVLNRVAQLADRDDPLERPHRHPFHSIIPLREILAELSGTGPTSRKVEAFLHEVMTALGSELNILLHHPTGKIHDAGFPELAEAITRMRDRQVIVEEGFDGQFGKVRVFADNETRQTAPTLFSQSANSHDKPPGRPLLSFSIQAFRNRTALRMVVSPVASNLQVATGSGELNPSQQRAVQHGPGPALVLAGPGTGKTRVLTERILHLIRKKEVCPTEILAITFARRAAESMGRRLREAGDAGEDLSGVTTVTFHGLGDRLLREFPRVAGRTPEFTLLDPEDRRWLLEHRLGLEKKDAALCAAAIHDAKMDPLGDPSAMGESAAEYSALLERMDALDLEDLLFLLLKTWKEDDSILRQCRERYQWVLVDEYQDVNPLQYELIRTLVPGPGGNLMVIGDPHQAIYGFRGADVRFIQSYQADFPGAVVYDLDHSYRCTDHILKASAQVVRDDPRAVAFQSGKAKGMKIHVSEHRSERSEAEFIARVIEEMSGGLRFFSMDSKISDGTQAGIISSLADFAVLCRTRRLMTPLRKAFQDHTIPFQEIGNTPFYREEPARSVLDLLHLALDPGAELPRERLSAKPAFKRVTTEHLNEAASLEPARALGILWDRWVGEKAGHESKRERLLNLASGWKGNSRDFLLHLSRGRGEDTFRPDLEAVALMTLHASKGLEFPVVFVPALEERIMPFQLYPDRIADPEEERRLLYVAMTRAREHLYLSHARKRTLDGRVHTQSPSPFLKSVQRNLAQWRQPDPVPMDTEPSQLKLFEI